MYFTSLSGRAGLIIAGTILLMAFLIADTEGGTVAKRDIDSLLDGKMKRPFCNAFTGCGKKRSDPELEGLASGSELDDITKHVLAEARLWEQLQNKMEAMRILASRMDSRPVFRRKRSLIQPQYNHANSAATLKHKGVVEKQ
ncbi:cardioactive peptide-like [Portunus trituberculatus]|uniref:Crustacean cardioactive peptide n=1 Tax=Portunus trituberculatus TaxID=210409 RepID=A0A2P1CYF8_PORTR|nr:cardioactive peptide-like [Portunus trituberculatus]AVK43051.1 crustacean cardioactive peptide [Portunus trituberculatus]